MVFIIDPPLRMVLSWSEEATPHPIPNPHSVSLSGRNPALGGDILQQRRQIWTTAMKGLLISKHRWGWEGQRLEQCQHTGNIWGLFVRLLGSSLALLNTRQFARISACGRWDCVVGVPVHREGLHCSPNIPSKWDTKWVPHCCQQFIPKPLFFHQSHLVLAQHIHIPFYSIF